METKSIISEYQVAVFPTNYRIEKVGEVAAKLMKQADYFDPDTVNMNPFDMSFAPEIERVSISSKDNQIRLSVSPKKISFHWINSKLEDDFEFNGKKSLSLITKILTVLEIDKLTIERCGFITNLIKKDKDPNKLIKENLLKNQIKNTLTNSQLKLTYKTSLQIIDNCNLHVVLTAGYLIDQKEDKVINIQFDLNTHQDSILKWRLDELSNFINQAHSKSSKELIYSAFFSEKYHGITI